MLKKFAAVLASLMLAVGLSVIAVAAPASAHHTDLSATAACTTDGGWDVTWSVINSENFAGKVTSSNNPAIPVDTVLPANPNYGKATTKVNTFVQHVTANTPIKTTLTVTWNKQSGAVSNTQNYTFSSFPASCATPPADTVDCTNATVYIGSKLTNGNYINMTVSINGQDKSMQAYVDIRRQGQPASESGLVLRVTKPDGGQIYLPISNAQRDSGILTFNYAAYLTGSWTVKWIQFDGHNWHFGADGQYLTCGTQEASAAVVLTDATCTTGQTVATGTIVGATWGPITYSGKRYSVTATALAGYAFPNKASTMLFSEELAGPTDGPECHPETPVTTPTAKAITECGTYGTLLVPANTDQVTYTLVGNGRTGINKVTATAVSPYVLTGYPEGGWSFNLGAYTDCVITLTVTYVPECAVDPANTWRVYNPAEDTVVVSYGSGLTHSATPGYSTFETPRGAETITIAWGAAGSGIAAGTASATATSDLGVNDPKCITLAEPVEPAVTKTIECGVYGTVVPVERTGVDYAVEFDTVTGDYTVTATPQDGYYFADGKESVVYTGNAGAYEECVVDTDSTIVYGECVWNEDGTANQREVAITFDNTKSNVPVLFEVPYFSEYNQTVPAGEKVTFSVANIWPQGGGYTVIAGGETFELTILPCDEPVKPEPKVRDEVVPAFDCTTAVVTVTTTTFTTDWVFDTQTGTWVEGDEVAGAPVITTRAMTAEETSAQKCLVTVTDPEASTCEINDATDLTSWIRVELNANVEYTIDGVVVTEEFTAVDPGEHTVVATALNGYTLTGATPEPDDWTDTTHTWYFTAMDPFDCELPTLGSVLPKYESTPLTCTTAGSYTIGAEFGDVTWTVNGVETAAGTYPVTKPGTVVIEASPTDPADTLDWEWVDEPITLDFTLPDGDCPTAALLAFTGGVATVAPVWAGAVLLLTGLGLILLRRKNTAQ